MDKVQKLGDLKLLVLFAVGSGRPSVNEVYAIVKAAGATNAKSVYYDALKRLDRMGYVKRTQPRRGEDDRVRRYEMTREGRMAKDKALKVFDILRAPKTTTTTTATTSTRPSIATKANAAA